MKIASSGPNNVDMPPMTPEAKPIGGPSQRSAWGGVAGGGRGPNNLRLAPEGAGAQADRRPEPALGLGRDREVRLGKRYAAEQHGQRTEDQQQRLLIECRDEAGADQHADRQADEDEPEA